MENKTKICRKCLVEKSPEDFNRDKRQSDGRRNDCKECRYKYEKALRDGNKEYAERQRENCRKWSEENPERVKEASKTWSKRNPELYAKIGRKSALKKKFNLTPEDYERMLEEQEGKCWICGKQNNNKTQKHFHIDHNHKTGQIRGLLCNKCNQGIGLLNDNIELLSNAVMYLRYFEEKDLENER